MRQKTVVVWSPYDDRMEVRLVGSWSEGVRAIDPQTEHELLYVSGVLGPTGDREWMVESVDPGLNTHTLIDILGELHAQMGADNGD